MENSLLIAAHSQIIRRLQEAPEGNQFGQPAYGMAEHPGVGDSSVTSSPTKKEGDEFKPTETGERRRELELADKILAAAKRMASTPDVEEIIRCADELKKLHGKT